MKLAELVWGVNISGENHFALPNSDAYRIVDSEYLLKSYQNEFGGNLSIVSVRHLGFKIVYWEVPSFQESRDSCTEAKKQDCQIWGCE